MDAVDRGAARSIADQLRLQHGFKNPLLGIATTAVIGSLILVKRVRKQTTAQVLKALEIYGRHVNEISKAIVDTRSRGFSYAPVAAAFVFARAADPHAADRFLDAIITGAELARNSPGLTLRNYLVRADRSRIGSLVERIDYCWLVLNALHAFVEKRDWPKPISSRAGYLYFAGRQKANLEKMAAIYLGEVAPLEPDRPGKARDLSPAEPPPAIITAKNFKLTPEAESLLTGISLSERAHRKAGTAR